jgi:hypothetical protein
MKQHPIARKDQLISEDALGECVIYDSRYKQVHHPNPTLTWIWHACDGKTSMSKMSSAFDRHFGVTDGAGIVLSGLRTLNACELLETPAALKAEFAAGKAETTRRGFVAGGSVLLPVLITMAAPTAAEAKSKDKDKDKPNRGNR